MKRVVFLLDDDLFKKAKIKAIKNDQNMTQYITGLIKDDLRKEEEDAESSKSE